mgnify:CR=1 FL=1
MGVVRRRMARWAAALAVLPLSLTGCGLLGGGEGGSGGGAPVEDGAEKARARVQAYLDAMAAKSVADGRAQLCTPLHESFDQAATGPNGDFADHFEVAQAEIVDIRAKGVDQEVSTSITVKVGERTSTARILFTVARADGEWCIAAETVGGNTPAPSGSADPAD